MVGRGGQDRPLRNQNARPPPGNRLVWTAADGVSDGGSDPDDVTGGEDVGVIHDVIVMAFGADEDVSPNVVAFTSAPATAAATTSWWTLAPK